MGVLDSFKQDAFSCSQTQSCTTSSRWAASWSSGWKLLVQETRGTTLPAWAREEEHRAGGCTDTTCDISALCYSYFFCPFKDTKWKLEEKEGQPAPDFSHPSGIRNTSLTVDTAT